MDGAPSALLPLPGGSWLVIVRFDDREDSLMGGMSLDSIQSAITSAGVLASASLKSCPRPSARTGLAAASGRPPFSVLSIFAALVLGEKKRRPGRGRL